MLSSAMKAGLYSVGANAIDLKVAPTPAVAYLTVKNEADAGIVISASHNPYKYNGIKIFGRDGFKISDETEERIEALVLDGEQIKDIPTVEDFGRNCDAAFEMEDDIKHIVDSGVRIDGVRIGIDAANGSCYESARRIFDSLGGECYFISTSPNGKNINEGCGSTHTEALKNLVVSNGLDAGFAFDGDADRCIAVDACGNEVDGDKIMYILAKRLKRHGGLDGNKIVTTVMSNLGLYRALDKAGIGYEITSVGDRFVYERMSERGYKLGGEQSGHIIIQKYASTGDGILTALLLCEEMTETSKTLAELCSGVVSLPQITKSIRVCNKDAVMNDSDVAAVVDQISAELGQGGRVLFRKSGTENVVRVTAECGSREKCRSVIDRIENCILSKGY